MLRVISGKVRGLKLDTPKNEDVRPTTDRVKESLFNIINPYVIDSNVLDLFAGTGSLGIECLSRGALSATYTIVNESKGLDAFLSADVITNTNPDDFFVTYFIDNPTLKAGKETRIKVLVTLKNTPIDENLSTTIKVDLTAEPQQPTEEPEYPTEEPPAEENYPAEEG